MLGAVLHSGFIPIEGGRGVAAVHTVNMVPTGGTQISVSLIAAAGMNLNGIKRLGKGQVVSAKTADTADGLNILQILKDSQHTGHAALGGQFKHNICIGHTALGLRLLDIVNHNRDRTIHADVLVHALTGQWIGIRGPDVRFNLLRCVLIHIRCLGINVKRIFFCGASASRTKQ